MPVQLRSISFRRPLSSCDLRGRWKQRVAFDEMHGTGAGSQCRVPYRAMATWLGDQSGEQLKARRQQAEALFRRDRHHLRRLRRRRRPTERLIPFDIIPRVLERRRMGRLARGLEQRVRALNAFIVRRLPCARRSSAPAGSRPSIVLHNAEFVAEMLRRRVRRAASTRTSPASTSCAPAPRTSSSCSRTTARTPSGVSYMLENREMMMRLFPDLFGRNRVRAGRALSRGPARARCARVAPPASTRDPTVARADARARTTAPTSSTPSWPTRWGRAGRRRRPLGQRRRRRHDAHHAGPAARSTSSTGASTTTSSTRSSFRPDSLLGVPGLMAAYRAGNVTIANAIGHRHRRRQVDLLLRAGDDPILPRRGADPATTCRPGLRGGRRPRLCARPSGRAGGEGGARLGRLRHAGRPGGTAAPRSRRSAPSVKAEPARYIAQPTLRCRPARPSSRAASRRATSTCARSCCRATECGIVPGRTDARRAARKARWSSIRARAAAPRTPGCSRTERLSDAVTHRRTTCSGWRATWSGPRTSRACSTSATMAEPVCRTSDGGQRMALDPA